jgi:hypothetical protein
MKIKLDNMDRDDWTVLITCENQKDAKDDQSVAGAAWEAPGDMDIAYTIAGDHPTLLTELEAEGYDVDSSEYSPPEESAA